MPKSGEPDSAPIVIPNCLKSYVKGYCKRCFHDCYQNVCENCCQPQSSATLLNPTCGACESRRFTVSDSHLESWLHFTEADIESVTELMRPVCFSNRRLVSLFRGLVPHEIALTYSTDYGIFPMALDGALNTWVEIGCPLLRHPEAVQC